MHFPGGTTSLDSLLKAYETSETKGFFRYECFDHPNEMRNRELPPYDAFYSKLRSCNPLETEYTDYVNLLKSGLTTEQAVIKLKLSKPSPTEIEHYHYLQQIWKQQQMSSFKEFLRWYNNKDVVPTLDAMQKKSTFYHDKDIEMLKLGCTLPKKILGSQLSTQNYRCKILSLHEGTLKIYRRKFEEDVLGGPSIVL